MKNKSNHRARRWVPYTGGVLLVALIVFGLWPRPVPVETARVSVGPLRATVNEEGKTRIRQRYVVSAPVTGQLERIPFKAGAEVQAGQVVAIIQPVAPTPLDARARTLAEARRDTAAANLEKARKAHEFAASELRRADKLFSDKTISPQEFDTFQWRETSAAKDLIVGEAALREAEAELAQFTPGSSSALSNCAPQQIKAPVSGQVLKVYEENARVVTAGAPLLELGDPGDLEVVIEVLSRDGATVVPGAKVEFEQWSSEAPVLEGRVRLVEPAAFTKVSALGVEEQRVNVIADLLSAPAQRRSLGDNFRVEARIVTWETNQTVKVPSGALFRHGSDWAAYVIKDGHAQLRVVEAGRSSGTETQILKGLQSGEEVILYPGSRVKDRQRVRQMQV